MKHVNYFSLLLLTGFMTPVIADTVNKSSDAYKAGQYIAYAFGVVFLFLIIKKLLGK